MKNATDVLIDGLSNLEYRGYDSAGISVFEGNAIETIKTQGRLQDLVDKLERQGRPLVHCGIGHTRWATHGEPSDTNSHPHATGKLTLVHNGIIENYLQIKSFLTEKGVSFVSQTDTETAARLIDYFYQGDPVAAIRMALDTIEGSYAFAILFADHPGTIYAVRKDSPLIVGLGEGENYVASDVPAILEHTRDYHLLDDGEIVVVTNTGVQVLDGDGQPVHKERMTANWDITQAQKGGYPHFMLKEIYEQPKALTDTIHPRVQGGIPNFAADGLPEDFFSRYGKIHIVACGTAMYAGTVGRSIIEKLARIPVEVDLASEFRYRDPILESDSLVLVVSQSGETADTLAALRLANNRGIDTLAIVNVTGSSIAREAKYAVHTYAGPEIAVASTKAFSVQVSVMYLLGIAFGMGKGKLSREEAHALTSELLRTVTLTPEILEAQSGHLREMAGTLLETTSLFYLGRGVDYALAMEGSLKLKEISYIHSEAYAAGELKHGTISLITDGVPVVALITQSDLLPKIVSNVKEARSRGGFVFVITREGLEIDADIYDDIVRLPKVDDLFMPLLSVIILQLLAYHASVARGCDVDKPRNLAKSVTVE